MNMYALVVYPADEVQNIANAYRKRYDTQYAFILPHIKLAEPFELPEERLPELMQELEKTALSLEPFTIRFHKVGSFAPTNNVVYLGIKDHSTLIKLNQLLEGILPTPAQQYSYIPHLTIGQNLTYGELNDVYSRLRMIKIDMDSLIGSFHLLVRSENMVWKTIQSFSFGK